MAKYLILGGSDARSAWRLPAETEIAHVESALKSALAAGSVEVFECEMNDDPRQRARVIVNGRAVSYAAVFEEPEKRTTGF